MVVSALALQLIVLAALVTSAGAPLVLLWLLFRDWREGKLW